VQCWAVQPSVAVRQASRREAQWGWRAPLWQLPEEAAVSQVRERPVGRPPGAVGVLAEEALGVVPAEGAAEASGAAVVGCAGVGHAVVRAVEAVRGVVEAVRGAVEAVRGAVAAVLAEAVHTMD